MAIHPHMLPDWLHISEEVSTLDRTLYIRHGELGRAVRLSCFVPQKDVIEIAIQHKKQLMWMQERADAVAAKLLAPPTRAKK